MGDNSQKGGGHDYAGFPLRDFALRFVSKTCGAGL
ncbi:MAG: hypothetical protein XD50_0434 [Clostridia bacterium 41_269]|nr:MAG: hypothetical protein XD50_0434 [Clostridia bacterium 41_269]